jgi:hypothetical protein
MAIADDVIKQFQQLPPDMQQEVADFVEFLAAKVASNRAPGFRLDWFGGLRDLRDKYTSVELQHKILELWGDA